MNNRTPIDNYAVLRSWIISYKSLSLYLLRKNANRELVYKSSLEMQRKRELLQLIEWKELQLMYRPIFNNDGYLLDNNFQTVRGSISSMNKTAAELNEKGYSVTIKPFVFLWRVKLKGNFTNTLNIPTNTENLNR